MRRAILILVGLLLASASVFAGDFDEYDLFAYKNYEEGFDAGVAYALGMLAHEAHGNAVTPYPVEVPSLGDDWTKSMQSPIAIHECVKYHMKRGLSQAGGGVNMVYFEIAQIVHRVLAYCGATEVRLSK